MFLSESQPRISFGTTIPFDGLQNSSSSVDQASSSEAVHVMDEQSVLPPSSENKGISEFDQMIADMPDRVWKCNRCLSMSHETLDCRNEIRCKACYRYGHIKHNCLLLKDQSGIKWVRKVAQQVDLVRTPLMEPGKHPSSIDTPPTNDKPSTEQRYSVSHELTPPSPPSFQSTPALNSSHSGKASVGVMETGVLRSTCSWAPSSAHLQPRGELAIFAMEKTLTRRRLVRRTTTETAKDQKTSSRAPAGEERRCAHVSLARFRAGQEGNGQKTMYRPRYPRQGGDQLSLCLPKAA
jgi:hypothetical protein